MERYQIYHYTPEGAVSLQSIYQVITKPNKRNGSVDTEIYSQIKLQAMRP